MGKTYGIKNEYCVEKNIAKITNCYFLAQNIAFFVVFIA